MNTIQRGTYNYHPQNLYKNPVKKSAYINSDFQTKSINSAGTGGNINQAIASIQKSINSGEKDMLLYQQSLERTLLSGGIKQQTGNKKIENADGVKNLTKDEINYLRGKYDVENMTNEDFYYFIKDLESMNILSKEEAQDQLSMPFPPGIPECGCIWTSCDLLGFEPDDNNFLQKIWLEKAENEFLYSAIQNNQFSMKNVEYYKPKLLDYYQERINSKEKLLHIMEQIKH